MKERIRTPRSSGDGPGEPDPSDVFARASEVLAAVAASKPSAHVTKLFMRFEEEFFRPQSGRRKGSKTSGNNQPPSLYWKLDPSQRERLIESIRHDWLQDGRAGLAEALKLRQSEGKGCATTATPQAFLRAYHNAVERRTVECHYDLQAFLDHLTDQPFPESAERAFARFHQRVYRLERPSYLRLFPEHDQEAVWDDIYLHFAQKDHRKLRSYRVLPDTSFLAWFHRVAERRALDLLRAAKRRLTDPLPEGTDFSDTHQGPHSEAISNEFRQALQECFDELSPKEKAVMTGVIEKVPREKLARTLGMTREQVFQMTADCRDRLRDCLTEKGH